MPGFTNRKVVIGAVSILTLALLLRLRKGRKAHNVRSGPTSVLTLPVVVTSATKEGLGLSLGHVKSYPPRLSAVPILGMPEAGNPIESACLVLDAVTLVADGASITGKRGEVEEALFAALAAAEIRNENIPAAIEAVKNYALVACPFMMGDTINHSAVQCERLVGTKSFLQIPSPKTEASGKKGAKKASHQLQQQTTEVAVDFSYLVSSSGLSVYMCPIPEANAVLSLIIVFKEGNADAADKIDITTALKSAFAVPITGLKQLIEAGTKCSTGVSAVEDTRDAAKKNAESTPTMAAAATKVSHAVFQNTEMRIRAVLPSLETTVEEVRVPNTPGTQELFLSVKDKAALPNNTFCRVIHYPSLPQSWEDESAITDQTEKVDEYKRSLMFHFLGIVSNSITLHSIDIGGRDSLWFTETSDGTTCRTYVCPNFDMSGKKKSKKRGTLQKGMIVIRWEAPTENWAQSLPALNAFLEYFQFE